MPASKIIDEQEVLRWFDEGRTYDRMVDEYRRKYHVETGASMWSNFRRRRGIARRIARDDDLIPWAVNREHRWAYPLSMLRVEARRRAAHELRESDIKRLSSWVEYLETNKLVVHYDPDTAEGFWLVPREKSDDDYIRKPGRKTTPRKAGD